MEEDGTLFKAALHTDSAAKPTKKRSKGPKPDKPLAEGLVFAEWADEFRLLNLYRREIIRGDNALHSLHLIRAMKEKHGVANVEGMVREYAREAKQWEMRYRRRPASFFVPDVCEQYLPTPIEWEPATRQPADSSIDDLRRALKTLREAGNGEEE